MITWRLEKGIGQQFSFELHNIFNGDKKLLEGQKLQKTTNDVCSTLNGLSFTAPRSCFTWTFDFAICCIVNVIHPDGYIVISITASAVVVDCNHCSSP